MKVVILAAGKGTRMLPLTEKVPKVLIEINGKPFLHYLIKALRKAGYDDLAIVVGYKKEKVFEFLKNYNIKAGLIEQNKQHGTAHALLCAEAFLAGENFLLVGGDNLWSFHDLKRFNIPDSFSYIAAKESDNLQKYGVLLTDREFLKKIMEKPKIPPSNLVNTGLYKFTPDILNALRKIKPSPRNELELTDAVNLLADEKKVKVIKLKDYWLDLGCPDDIPLIERFLHERA